MSTEQGDIADAIRSTLAEIFRNAGGSALVGPIKFLRSAGVIDQTTQQRLLEQAQIAVERRDLIGANVAALRNMMEAGVEAINAGVPLPVGSAAAVVAYAEGIAETAAELRKLEGDYHSLVAAIRTRVRAAARDKGY